MVNFKNIRELILHIESLLKIENKEINDIVPFEMIFKLSAEKIAKRFDVDEKIFVKELNQFKKKIHKKIIIYNKVKLLNKTNLDRFIFFSQGIEYKTKICICEKLFESKFKNRNFTFYPDVKYLYVELDKTIILFPRHKQIKLYATKNEFSQNFKDIREYKINLILNI